MRALLLLLLAAVPCACASTPGSPRGSAAADHRILETASGASLSVDRAADLLARHDVVFLGEEHDKDVGHRLQLQLTEALLERRGVLILSLEMFERDVQAELDAYLAGECDEATFLARSRPWPNYAEAYRPGVELARREGLAVLAANVPRPLASRVVREGPLRVLAAAHAPRMVLTPPGEYRRRFDQAMGGHGGMEGLNADHVFAAQCLKDDAMAESIADALAARPGILVVHWCGRFHSDGHLGTVERLALRRPDLSIGVVTMTSDGDLDRPLDEDERRDAELVLRVPPARGRG